MLLMAIMSMVPMPAATRRLSELDLRVDLLWSHLSARDSTTDSLVQEQVLATSTRANSTLCLQASFRDSLSRLSRDVDQSTVHHSSLLHRSPQDVPHSVLMSRSSGLNILVPPSASLLCRAATVRRLFD